MTRKRLNIRWPVLLILFLVTRISAAQLCTGSLGEPIVNITFGSGNNPGPSLSAATTNYSFVSNDCPNDGFYTVRNNTGVSSSCFGASWHTVASDHTGDANGYFMLVNASVTPGAFYVDTVRGLCAGATFEFAAWVMNVMRPSACSGNGIKPNLTFSIERTNGTVIQSFTTGDIADNAGPLWQQYGFFFTTPPGVSDVVLRIVNSAPGGCGNDLALDDITFRPCGPSLTTLINGTGSNADVVCRGDARSFTFSSTISTGYNNPSFQWQLNFNGSGFTDIAGATGSALPVSFLANAQPGTYVYRIAAAETGSMGISGCRVYSPVITITVEEKPVFMLSSNAPVCVNANLQITATSAIAAQYQWNGPLGFNASGATVTLPAAQIANSGKYYALATTAGGCTHLDSITVTINPNPVATVSPAAPLICEGSPVTLTAGGGLSYRWLPAAGLSDPAAAITQASPVASQNYEVIVANAFNCTDTAAVTVTVTQKPEADAGPDQFTIEGIPVQFQGIAGGDNVSPSWFSPAFLDNASVPNPVVNAPAGEYVYQLSVTSGSGCGTATDLVRLVVYSKLFVPTAFTPDGDGKNDRWQIPALRVYPDAVAEVYNRYGQLVYTGRATDGWDGRFKGQPQPAGVYAYLLRLQDGKGTVLTGTVALIR